MILPFKSIPKKSLKASQLVEGDVVLYGDSASGAFHIITKMHGIKKLRKTTRIVFDWKFYAIIRRGNVIFDKDHAYDPTNQSARYLDTKVEIIHNQIVKI